MWFLSDSYEILGTWNSISLKDESPPSKWFLHLSSPHFPHPPRFNISWRHKSRGKTPPKMRHKKYPKNALTKKLSKKNKSQKLSEMLTDWCPFKNVKSATNKKKKWKREPTCFFYVFFSKDPTTEKETSQLPETFRKFKIIERSGVTGQGSDKDNGT